MSASSPALQLLDLIQSHRVTAVIHVAAKLGIADLLAGGPKPLGVLVKATGADDRALARLLAALTTIGICVRGDRDCYALTETGAALAASARPSFRAWAIFEAEMLQSAWAGMLETVMTGKTAAEVLGFDSSFDLMARVPENIGVFNAAMADLTRVVTADVLAACDLGRFSHLMDVGGGSGELIGAALERYADLRGTVFDLARCGEAANAHLARMGLNERASFIAGDFFESIPTGADGIILKSVIHDWDDRRSGVILRNCRNAFANQGTLLLIERLMPEQLVVSAEHRSCAMSDLNMLRGPGGMERTEAQYRDLLSQAGFRTVSVVAAGRFAVIEAKLV